MKKTLILFFVLIATNCFAAPPTRVATYTSGETILSADVTNNEDAIFNYVQAGIDTIKDGTILNADVNSSANIQSEKLNLTSIAQGVAITSSGSLTNAGTLTQSGAATLSGANTLSGATAISGALTVTGNSTFTGVTIADLGTVTTAAFTTITDLGNVTTTGTIGLGGKLTATGVEIEGDTFDINGGDMTGVTISGALTWSANQDINNVNFTNVDIDSGAIDGVTIGAASAPTVTDLGTVTTCDINGGTIDGVTIGGASAPTVTDLGSVTTADINGGTLDGVQIGGTTATGELIVNNSSDDADGLGSQGTTGQLLTSAGAGSNPTWSDARAFGSWTTATEGSSTQASTDGFIVVFCTGNDANGAVIKTDSANPPTVTRAYCGKVANQGSGMSPVKSGEYYLIDGYASSGNYSSYWIPSD